MENRVFGYSIRDGVGKRHIIVVLLLALPSILSMFSLDKILYGAAVHLLLDVADNQVFNFSVTVMSEAVASLLALSAFIIIYPKAVDRNPRRALWVLSVCELYMFLYYSYMLLNPLSRNAVTDILGSMLLLLSIMVCCYGYSLFYACNRLEPERRSWAVFLFMSYIMSFTALFAPSWQSHIPFVEGNSKFMPDYSPLYVVFAFLWNLLRAVALWKLFTSSLFVENGKECDGDQSSLSPVNRYLLAILIASLFVVKGLALVYENTFLLLEL